MFTGRRHIVVVCGDEVVWAVPNSPASAVLFYGEVRAVSGEAPGHWDPLGTSLGWEALHGSESNWMNRESPLHVLRVLSDRNISTEDRLLTSHQTQILHFE